MAKKKVFSISTELSQGLEETIESAQNYSGDLRVDVIPLKKIDLDPDNPRKLALNIADILHGISDQDSEKERKQSESEFLQSLANSIKTHGILNPIIVYKHGERYRLVAGERRVLGSLKAGKSDIQAKILDDKPDALKISLLQWIENIERADLSLWERLGNLKKIVDAYSKASNINPKDITITDLSNLIGCVKSHAINYKSILNADEEITRLISENKISSLKKAAFLSEIQDKNVKTEAIEACLAGATLEQIKKIEKQLKLRSIPLKSVERRGRQTTVVNFGVTKNIKVAKAIIESILKNASLKQINEQLNNIDWNNPRMISDVFKQVLKTLEEIHM